MRLISPSRLAKIKTCDKTPCCRGFGEKVLSSPPRDGDTGPSPKRRSIWQYLSPCKQQIPFNSEIYTTDIPVRVQKDSRTRLFIVRISTDGKRPKCPTVQIAQVHTGY